MLLGVAHAREALAQTWPPFMLVAGLLLRGRLAGEDGLFDAAASRLERLRAGPPVTLLACLALVALVTAVLNLDTAAVLLTPVLIAVARRRLAVAPFLYGGVFMANASSLYVPGSNLTLWWRAARAAGVRPSALDYSRQGLVLAPAAMLCALLAAGLL